MALRWRFSRATWLYGGAGWLYGGKRLGFTVANKVGFTVARLSGEIPHNHGLSDQFKCATYPLDVYPGFISKSLPSPRAWGARSGAAGSAAGPSPGDARTLPHRARDARSARSDKPPLPRMRFFGCDPRLRQTACLTIGSSLPPRAADGTPSPTPACPRDTSTTGLEGPQSAVR